MDLRIRRRGRRRLARAAGGSVHDDARVLVVGHKRSVRGRGGVNIPGGVGGVGVASAHDAGNRNSYFCGKIW